MLQTLLQRRHLWLKKSSPFPWRIFSHVILIQAVLILVLFLFSGLAARSYFKSQSIAQIRLQLHDTLVALSQEVSASPSLLNADWCSTRTWPHSPALKVWIKPNSTHPARTPLPLTALCDSTPSSSESRSLSRSPMLEESLEFPQFVLVGSLPLTRLNDTLRTYDTSLGLSLTGIAILLCLFAVTSARRLVFPIGRMLVKAKGLLNPDVQLNSQKTGMVSALEGLDEEPYGEWTDLEYSIEEIRRDLEAKIDSLKVEREEQATLMSAISDAILAVDTEGAPLFYNSRLALLLENPKLKAGKRLWEIFRDPEILETYRVALKEGKSGSVKAIPMDHPMGKRFFSVAVSPLRKNKESIYGAVGIFHDVTDLKRAEQIRIDFVANVSHELHTPLTSIKGYTDTLMQDHQQGKTISPEYLEIISKNTDRLMNLIHDLLDLSSIESADILHKTHLNTEELTKRVMKQMHGAFEAKRQDIQVAPLASTVLADPTRIEQVLVNLLDNAHKYTPAGGKISVHWEPGSGNDIVLKVIDSGPGIPPEHHARLFERFYRVDKARSREKGGTGLGLAIVKHIMQRHEGTVWVDSSPGKGSTFGCRFPG